MGWSESYPYAGRQPPAARVSIRKAANVNTGAGQRSLNRGYASGMRKSGLRPSVDGCDFLSHADGAVTVVRTLPEDTLEHFGIPGMKWGIRRYQNEDGTLTEAGKQRYGGDSQPESKSWKKADADKLSDDELNRRNSRLQREQQYKNLTTTDAERNRQQIKNDFKKSVLKAALITPVVGILAYAGTKFIKNNGTKMVDMLEKYGKKAVSRIKTNNLLKQAASRGHGKYERQFSEGLREYFPRQNGGYGMRSYDFVKRVPPLWKRQVVT